MITSADFLGYICVSIILSWLIGYFINGIFSIVKFIRE